MLETSLQKTPRQTGFTLIELSIVLVIIGLIIGGILTGQDLINAAAARAQISQIEKYNTAARTFQGKYGYLPGDIPDPQASSFGFKSRGTCIGEGNGDGILEGDYGCSSFRGSWGNMESDGELVMFWVDLSTAGLIDAGLNTANSSVHPGGNLTGTTIGNYFPQAKIGLGNYVYVWGGDSSAGSTSWVYTGIAYYGISVISTLAGGSNFGAIAGTPGLTVNQAYNIDKKVDDGLPQSGNVTACYLNYAGDSLPYQPIWAAGNALLGAGAVNCVATTNATPYLSTNCYDNAIPGSTSGTGGQSGVTQTYSLSQNANVQNCALSFQFQ